MFLDTLHELNAHVTNALLQAGICTFPIAAGDIALPTMEFLRPDYTTIVKQIPTHRINVGPDSVYHKTVSDWANTIVKFVLDAANEFAKPRIHMSNVYLNYDPKRQAQSAVLIFDIAIWDYVDLEVQWLNISPGDQHRLGHSIGHHRPPSLYVDSLSHTLLKQNPFEINIWTANILRDVGFLSHDTGSSNVLAYMIKLEQELIAGARAAADVLNKMQRAAQVHDVVNALWHANSYQEAADVLSKAITREVGIHEANDGPYLTLDEGIYSAHQAFAMIAGLDVKSVDLPDVEIDEPLTEEERAAGIRIAAPYVASTHAEDVARLMRMPTGAEFFYANDPAARLKGSLGDKPKEDKDV